MTEPQPFDAVDELYRRTFEELPPSPASSGWDTPSPKVWDTIYRQLPQTRGGWSVSGWLLTGFLMALLGMVLWRLLPDAERAAATPLQEDQAVTAPATSSAAEHIQASVPQSGGVSEPAQDEPLVKPTATKRPKAPKAAPVQEMTLPVPVPPVQAEEAIQTPPAAPQYPNNAERRRAEALKKRWDTPLQPLPDLLEKQKRW
jgi:hypothetical protein